MNEYLYVFRGGDAPLAALSPEAKQTHMQKWGAWIGELGEKGHMIAGEPLETEGKTVTGTEKIVTDGPFAEGREIVGGYLIVKANDLDQATELSKGCPIFEHDGILEVRPIAKIEMPD